MGQVLREVEGTGALYLGDLDVKGVRIPAEFNAAARGDSPRVLPALEHYAWLLANGVRRVKLECKAGTLAQAEAWFGPELAPRVFEMWQEGAWIPQEALGFEQLLELSAPKSTPRLPSPIT